MTRDEVLKLLGGYATGTLTDEERQALMEAALEDQELFNALADEEALRQMLSDAAYRRELVEELEPRGRFGWLAGWWRRPAPVAAAACAAALVVAVVIVREVGPQRAEPVEIAMTKAPEQARQEEAAPAGRRAAPSAAEPVEAETEEEPPAQRSPVASDEASLAEFYLAEPSEAPLAVAPPKDELAKSLSSRVADAEGVAGAAKPPVRGAAERPFRARASKVAAMREITTSDPVLRVERRILGGEFADTDPAALRLGDEIRLMATAPGSGYLYVTEEHEGASPTLLYTVPAQAGQEVAIPEQGVLSPPEGPAERRLVVLYSRTALGLDELGVTGAYDADSAEGRAALTLRYE